MSQVFSGDSVNGGTVSVVTTNLTTIVTGNFLNPPFGNAKVVVMATCNLTAGAGTTSANFFVFRNPNAENVNVAGVAQGVTMAAGNAVQIVLQVADVIPDGRSVQYALKVAQVAATGNGTVNFSNIAAFLISG